MINNGSNCDPSDKLQAEPVEFGRGGSRLTIQAQRDLRALKES